MKEMTISNQPDSKCEYQEGMAQYIPVLVLNREGFIECLTTAARQLMEYRPGQRIQLPFLSHVHRRNMYRIMRDLEEMILHGRRKASWLLRLKTGQERWRWYKAMAERRPQGSSENAITVLLKPL